MSLKKVYMVDLDSSTDDEFMQVQSGDVDSDSSENNNVNESDSKEVSITESDSEDEAQESMPVKENHPGKKETKKDNTVKEVPQRRNVARVNTKITSSTESTSKVRSTSAHSTKNKKMLQTNENLTTKEMIINAVKNSKSRNGASSVAIRKYINDAYDVTSQRLAMITKLLRNAHEEGWLIQTSGIGASSGSHFKLSADVKKDLTKTKKRNDSAATKDKMKVKVAAKRKINDGPNEVAPKKKNVADSKNMATEAKKRAINTPKKVTGAAKKKLK